ncbi:hypothetical protein EUX98_g5808 [Antrodiella citrinella]|uniref:Histone chaperone domain-containing protein n=1 Tax=Antrodiella citrinella TaxID=2447956 RepID=A0A4S4MQK6_9APHY|nr:hypothetical protein EUX98_g5808 [Antrodiella citrinella]
MASDATAPANPGNTQETNNVDAPVADKGKGKAKLVQEDVMDEDDDDDEEEEEAEEDDDELEDDNLEGIDTSAILAPGTRRSTRVARVDYSSAEALQKAGLTPDEATEEEEHEESFVANDDDMKDD